MDFLSFFFSLSCGSYCTVNMIFLCLTYTYCNVYTLCTCIYSMRHKKGYTTIMTVTTKVASTKPMITVLTTVVNGPVLYSVQYMQIV